MLDLDHVDVLKNPHGTLFGGPGCRKTARLIGDGPRKKAAARSEVLETLLATCDDSLAGVRDRALLLFGWSSGGRCRAEIARAELADLEWTHERGELHATFTKGAFTKTNQK
jgi:hypothetical protein